MTASPVQRLRFPDNRTEAPEDRRTRLASLGSLAAGIAHEINTPVQYVSDSVSFLEGSFEDLLGYVDELERMIVELASGADEDALTARLEKAREDFDIPYVREHAGPALSRSVDGLRRVADIAQAMKRIAHEDADRRRPTDLVQLLDDTLLMASCEYRFVAEVHRDYEPIPLVLCDRSAIGQVFLNLLVNAADAIRERHEGAGSGTIRVRTETKSDAVVVSLSDDGCGIPHHLMERVFEPFFTTKPVGRGSGQGLSLVARIVEEHAGDLHVHSEVGVGTTFQISLPIGGTR